MTLFTTRARRCAVLRVVATCATLVTARMSAQAPKSPLSQTQRQAAVSSSFLPADTAIRPGHIDYSRYDTPGACLQAMGLSRNVAERAELDTSRYAPEHDTLPTAAVTAARACGARFTLQNTPARELFNLAQLALATGDDATATAAAERWLAAIPDKTPLGKAWAMLDVVTLYMQARPMRFNEAEAILARMDSVGRVAAVPRMIGHMALYVPASRRFDAVRIERDGMAILTLDPQLTKTERDQILFQTEENVVGALSLGLPMVLFDLAIANAYQHPEDSSASRLISAVARTGFNAMPPDTLLSYLKWVRPFTASVPLPSLPAKYWYGTQGPHVFPVPGKVSLYLTMSANNGSYDMFSMVRRLHEEFGDSLSITIFTATAGYFHDSPPLEPAQEVEAVQHYFLDYLKLPVNVAIDEAPFERLPDGRRVSGQAPFEKVSAYKSPYGNFWNAALVDQKGRSILLGIGMGGEEVLDAFIKRALGRPETR